MQENTNATSLDTSERGDSHNVQNTHKVYGGVFCPVRQVWGKVSVVSLRTRFTSLTVICAAPVYGGGDDGGSKIMFYHEPYYPVRHYFLYSTCSIVRVYRRYKNREGHFLHHNPRNVGL